jgi:hypothetical protein
MSYAFDGANDTLTGAFGTTYQIPMTIACWIKVAAHPVAGDIIMTVGKNAAATTDSFDIRSDTTDDVWGMRAIDSAAAASNAMYTLNIDATWTPIVAVYTSATDRKIYVGSYSNAGSSTQSRTVLDVGYVRLGEALNAAGDYVGNIAEAAVWDKALSQAEIEAYCAGTAASGIGASDLIGYWPLNASNATQSNLGVDSAGDLTVTSATYDADHPTISSGGAARQMRHIQSYVWG